MKKVIMVSACLIGLPTRYDGKSKPDRKVLNFLKSEDAVVIPFCPEQLGGLPTPRVPSEIQGKKGWREGVKVLNEKGEDVTENFRRGAEISLKIAQFSKPDLIIMKERSPSCGVNCVYDGTFSKAVVSGMGATAYYLKKDGYKIISEEDL